MSLPFLGPFCHLSPFRPFRALSIGCFACRVSSLLIFSAPSIKVDLGGTTRPRLSHLRPQSLAGGDMHIHRSTIQKFFLRSALALCMLSGVPLVAGAQGLDIN